MIKNRIKRVTIKLAKKAFHGFLCFLIIFNQIAPTYAQSITVDGGAAASNQADLTTAPNGVPVINIVTPNGAGVSHNQFTDYNVTNQGLILNNSRVVGTSQLGGAIIGNPNVAGGEANLIINEVTSANSSSLEGATEVFGPATNVIVANPNGITCDGCGFINTPKATLTTGAPQFDGAGALSNISVNNGTITIQGTGLEVTGNNKAEILSRAIKINGDIHAGEINLITGRNDIDRAGVVTPKADDGSPKPALAIDSSALGGMYAGKITLTGTESGVGFKLDGDMAASTSDLIITNDGKIEIKNASAQRDVRVTTTGANDIDLTGKMTSQGETVLDSGNDINLNATATIESSGANTQVKAANKINNQQGAIIGYQNVTINTDELENNEGLILAGNDLSIEGVAPTTAATLIENTGGSIESFGGDVLIRAGTLNNIGAVEIESKITNYKYRWKITPPPSYIPHGQDLSNEAWPFFRNFPHGQSHVMAINPYYMEEVLAAKGKTLEDYKDSVTDDYTFEISDWQSLAPQTYSEWVNILGLRSNPTPGLLEKEKRWQVLAPDGLHTSPSGSFYIVQFVEDSIVPDTYKKSTILSEAGNINIFTNDITNKNSFISAANDINISGNNLNLLGVTLKERVRQRTSYNNSGGNIRDTGWGKWLTHVSEVTTFSENIGSVPSAITAGGLINGDFVNDITVSAIPATSIRDLSVDGVDSDIIRDVLRTGNRQANIFNNTALVAPAADTNFLFETRFDFTNLGTFFGSDYFLNGVLGGYDPDSITKRLGDAYIDSRYITEQVIAQSGRKYLDTAFASDTDQVKALLDRGIEANTALNLSPLVALTVEQQRVLTEDIVWYEERVINGETVIVPQLYLASATLDAQGQKIRAATISGLEVNLTAENVNSSMGRVTALGDVNIDVNDSIVVQSGVVDGTNVSLNAGNDIILTTQVASMGNGTTEIGTNKNLTGLVTATNDVNLTSGELVAVIGADVNAGNDLNINAKNVSASSLRLESGFKRSQGGNGDYAINVVSQNVANLDAGTNVNVNVLENIRVTSSNINAKENINLEALAGSVLIDTAQESRYEHFKSDTRDHTKLERTHHASKLTTQDGDINIKSTLGNVTLKAAELDSGNDINLEVTTGQVALLTAKDYDFEDNTGTKSNAVWQSYKNKGHEIETIRHTILTGEGDLNIIAANGVVVEYEHTGNLDADIAQLSKAPELAWMAALKDDPNVDFKAVEGIYREWHEESEGLSGPAMAVIAIAVAVVTQGAGASLLASAQGVATSTLSATATAVSNAAFTSLVSQATISAINNKGNLGNILGELASAETVRSLAAAALTAGLLEKAGASNLELSSDFGASKVVIENLHDQLIAAGIKTGVGTVVSGEDLSDSLKSNLRLAGAAVLGAQLSQEIGESLDSPDTRAFQLIAHAAVGCVSAQVANGQCGAGAAGAFIGEAAALAYRESLTDDMQAFVKTDPTQEQIDIKLQEWKTAGVDIARLSGALAAFVGGADADGVNAASDAGGTSAANNALPVLLVMLAVASAGYTTVDVANIYVTEGPEAAMEELAINGAVTLVTSGVGVVAYKVGGKVIKNADEAYKAYQATKGVKTSTANLISLKDINRANHLFGKKSLEKHDLTEFLNYFDGDQIKAYKAIEKNTQRIADKGLINDTFETIVKINGKNITVQGRVINGKVNIATAFIPK